MEEEKVVDAEVVDNGGRKELYRMLISDKNKSVSDRIKKYSFKQFEDKLLTDVDTQEKLANYLISSGAVADPDEFTGRYLQAKQPTSQQPQRPVQVPTLLQPAQQGPSLTAVTGRQAVTPMAPEPQFQPFQFQNEKEIQQAAKSPVFLANKPAMQVMEDRAMMKAANPLEWRQDETTGKYGVYDYGAPFEAKPLATFDTMNEAASMVKNMGGRSAASDALIMPTKEAEQSFNQLPADQQRAAIEGGSGFELSQKKANEKRSGLQKLKDFGKALGGMANNAYDAILASEKLLGAKQRDLLTFGGAEENLKKVKKEVLTSMDNIQNQYAQDLRNNNIETSLIDAVNNGELNRLPEAVGYNVANAIVSGLGAAFTGGYSMFAQTLADDYKSGVENLAKETGRTPEQVIADGDDAELIPAVSATIQGLIEKAQLGLASKAIDSKGAYKFIRDLVIKKAGKKSWSRAAGAGLGITGASLESGLQGVSQELTSMASEQAAGSDSFDKFYDKLSTAIASEEGSKRLNESLVGEAIGAGGLIGGGRALNAGFDMISRPPSQLGGIPTQDGGEIVETETITDDGKSRVVKVDSIDEVPVDKQESATVVTLANGKKEFWYREPIETVDITEAPIDETTFVTVTPEELDAFKQGTVDPERAAGIADDVAAIQKGELTLEAIEDPLYRQMVETTLQSNETTTTTTPSPSVLGETTEATGQTGGGVGTDVQAVDETITDETPLNPAPIPVAADETGGTTADVGNEPVADESGGSEVEVEPVLAEEVAPAPAEEEVKEVVPTTKPKVVDKAVVKGLLIEANDEYDKAKSAFDKKKSELNKTTREDTPDLFGKRKVEEGTQSLFEIPRISPQQRDKAIQPFRDRLDKAKKEINRLSKLLNEGQEITQKLKFESNEQVQTTGTEVREGKGATKDESVVRKKTPPVRNAGRTSDAIAARNIQFLGDPYYSSLQYVMDMTYHPDLLQSIFGGPDKNSKSGRKSIEGERKPRIQFLDKNSTIKTADRLGELLAEKYAEDNGISVKEAEEKHNFTDIAESIILNHSSRNQMVKAVLDQNDLVEDQHRFQYDPEGIYGEDFNEDAAKDVDNALDNIPDSYWEGMDLTDDQYNELFAPEGIDSPFTAFDPPSESMSREQGRKARAALKEAVGPEQFKRMEAIHKNKEKILKGLEERQLIKIECP